MCCCSGVLDVSLCGRSDVWNTTIEPVYCWGYATESFLVVQAFHRSKVYWFVRLGRVHNDLAEANGFVRWIVLETWSVV